MASPRQHLHLVVLRRRSTRPSLLAVGAQRLARRGDVRAVPRGPRRAVEELARLLRRLPARRGRASGPSSGNGHSGAEAAKGSRARRAATRRRASTDASPPRKRAAATVAEDGPEPTPRMRGVGARIVENMETSLGVPTATSVRDVPAKLLEVNRRIINNYLRRTRGGKVSFTHLIAYAMVKAVEAVPAMKSTFAEAEDGKPVVVRADNFGLGLAVDVENKDGSRSLLVPVIRDADTLELRGVPARLRGDHPQDPDEQARPGDVRRRDDHGHQPRHHRHGPLDPAPDGRSVRHPRRRLDRLPDRATAATDPRTLAKLGCRQGHHADLDLRPPRHPGRRVGAVPQARPRAADRRARLLRRGLPRRSACPTSRPGGGPTPPRFDAESDLLAKQRRSTSSPTCTGSAGT